MREDDREIHTKGRDTAVREEAVRECIEFCGKVREGYIGSIQVQGRLRMRESGREIYKGHRDS